MIINQFKESKQYMYVYMACYISLLASFLSFFLPSFMCVVMKMSVFQLGVINKILTTVFCLNFLVMNHSGCYNDLCKVCYFCRGCL